MSDDFDCGEIVLRYEKARQLVSELKKVRADLISKCSSVSLVMVDGFAELRGELCLHSNYREWAGEYEENGYISLSILDYMRDANENGECCDACLESIKIKRGPLMDAKKEFGMAKRSLSHAGKRMIKEEYSESRYYS